MPADIDETTNLSVRDRSPIDMTTARSSLSAAKRPALIFLALVMVASLASPAHAEKGRVYVLAGDWNADGASTPGWFIDGTVILRGASASGATLRFTYGRAGDVLVAGDWNCDGRDTVGIVRSGRHWHLRNSNTAGPADRTFTYGGWLGIDRSVVGDWNGNGCDTIGVVRGSTWYLRNSLSGGAADLSYTFGRVHRGDGPIVGDWVGDGRDTAGVVRDGVWHLRQYNRGRSTVMTFDYGRGDDLPVVGNWNGRGGDTPGVVRGTTWLLKNRPMGGAADVTLIFADRAIEPKLQGSTAEPAKPPKAPTEPVREPEPSDTTAPSQSTKLPTEEPTSSLTTTPDPASSETAPAPVSGSRLLYPSADIAAFEASMATPGPFFAMGDAGHGGQYSPNDGQRAVGLAREFLANPRESYWSQPNLPYAAGDPGPVGMVYARPMHAAWVWMTQPANPDREALSREVKKLLLAHANDPSLDYGDATKYPSNFHGAAQAPIFLHAQWMTRLIKTRDMLGREMFTSAENTVFDRWVYDYANWTANWLHREQYGKALPGRLSRDYSKVNWPSSAERRSYDGGPLIGVAGMAYTNRHSAVASAMSLGANYLKRFGYVAPSSGGPSYGRYDVDQLVDHSRLFVEETLRFSVWPQGFQGDFERSDARYHSNSSPQQGWLYSVNVLANLLEMAEYHAKRGDLSVWNYGTTAGHAGSAGTPVAGGFTQKNLHFYAWSMSRYVNDGWQRTNRGERLAQPHFYHDVIPAATAHRFVPQDRFLEAAWKRSGQGFPAYPASPQSQGPYHAHDGEGGKAIGLIEQARASSLK